MTAGRSLPGKVATILQIELQELGTWLLCSLMYFIESVNLAGWLVKSKDVSTYQSSAKQVSYDR